MTKSDAQTWLKENGAPKFEKIPFFPGAHRTTPFGIALKITRGKNGFARIDSGLRIHNAVDRARGEFVTVPFNSEPVLCEDLVYKDSFGTLLFLRPDGADFEIRIAHLNPAEFTDAFRGALTAGHVDQGVPIGPAGDEGKSTGPHIHTEIVSIDETSAICDALLSKQDEKPIDCDSDFLYEWARRSGVSPFVARNDFKAQQQRKRIELLTNKRCVRIDYHTGKKHTFYSSWHVFNHL